METKLVRIGETTHKLIKIYSAKEGKSIKEFVEKALIKKLFSENETYPLKKKGKHDKYKQSSKQ